MVQRKNQCWHWRWGYRCCLPCCCRGSWCQERSSCWKEVVGVNSHAERSPKPYRLSPVKDHERRHSRGLLSHLEVHAARRDGEELEGSVELWNQEAVGSVSIDQKI
jgi:hypothetical protein